MLLRFTIENFMSFKDEAVLSLLPSKVSSHPEHVIKPAKSSGLRALKTAVIYGANASGKSNLIKALAFAQRLLVQSELAGKNLPNQAFKLDKASAGLPSRFEVEIKCGDRFYAYGFAIHQKIVVEEWLFEISKTKEKAIFERSVQDNKTIIALDSLVFAKAEDKQFLEFVAKGTADNHLFLRECFERNVMRDLPYITGLSEVFHWFKERLTIIFPNSKYTGLEMALHNADASAEQALSALLNQLDTGVCGLCLKKVNFETEISDIPFDVKEAVVGDLSEHESALISGQKGIRYLVKLDAQGLAIAYKLMTAHHDSDGDEVLFEVNQESDGTQRLLDLAPGLLELFTQDKVYIIDELDRSLHSEITTRLVSSFLSLTSQRASQLIVTTHESNLLNLDVLRRDEIWFVQKNSRGQSALYSLEEFKARFDKDIRKGYLVGRFGGVPVLKGQIGVGTDATSE